MFCAQNFVFVIRDRFATVLQGFFDKVDSCAHSFSEVGGMVNVRDIGSCSADHHSSVAVLSGSKKNFLRLTFQVAIQDMVGM